MFPPVYPSEGHTCNPENLTEMFEVAKLLAHLNLEYDLIGGMAFVFCCCAGIEPRISCTLNTCFTAELHTHLLGGLCFFFNF